MCAGGPGAISSAPTLHDLLVPGTFLAGPPRWAQRAVLGTLAALARATMPYAAPEFDRDPAPLG